MPAEKPNKWQRTKILLDMRRTTARALLAVRQSPPGSEAHRAALADCALALQQYLFTTSTEQQIDELRAEFPGLPEFQQPELFAFSSGSIAAK